MQRSMLVLATKHQKLTSGQDDNLISSCATKRLLESLSAVDHTKSTTSTFIIQMFVETHIFIFSTACMDNPCCSSL